MKFGTDVGESMAQDEQEAPVPLIKKNGDPWTGADGTPTRVFVLGRESKRYRDAKARIRRSNIKSFKTITPEQEQANRIEQAASVVTRWEGVEDDAGQPAPCSLENIRQLLRSEENLEQVELGILGHADFFSKPSTS